MGQLSYNKPYEAEVRFFVDDIGQFRKKVEHLGGEILKEYSFTDYYYLPTESKWDSNQKTLRIREWHKPSLATAVWFTKHEIIDINGYGFKKSLYQEGKVELFSAEKEVCQTLLKDLGFIPSYVINKKQGWVWQIKEKNLEFCVEEVEGLGWTGEIELDGTDLDSIKGAIQRHKEALDLADNQLSNQPLLAIFEERFKL